MYRVTFPPTFDTHTSQLPPSWQPSMHMQCQDAVVGVAQWMDRLPKYRDLPSELGGSGVLMEQSSAPPAPDRPQSSGRSSAADEAEKRLRASLLDVNAKLQRGLTIGRGQTSRAKRSRSHARTDSCAATLP